MIKPTQHFRPFYLNSRTTIAAGATETLHTLENRNRTEELIISLMQFSWRNVGVPPETITLETNIEGLHRLTGTQVYNMGGFRSPIYTYFKLPGNHQGVLRARNEQGIPITVGCELTGYYNKKNEPDSDIIISPTEKSLPFVRSTPLAGVADSGLEETRLLDFQATFRGSMVRIYAMIYFATTNQEDTEFRFYGEGLEHYRQFLNPELGGVAGEYMGIYPLFGFLFPGKEYSFRRAGTVGGPYAITLLGWVIP